jgi:hypothetical protein
MLPDLGFGAQDLHTRQCHGGRPLKGGDGSGGLLICLWGFVGIECAEIGEEMVNGRRGRMYIPRSSTSRSTALIFCSSISGAFGSKRPSFWAFFHAKTLSVRVSYSVDGMTYFSTADTSVRFVRADGGRVSVTWRFTVSVHICFVCDA